MSISSKPGSVLLARKLKSLRLSRGWNMDRVAAQAGVSRTTLFNLERGEVDRPHASTLHKLAEVLGVAVDELDFDEQVSSGATGGEGGVLVLAGERQFAAGRTASRAFDRATNPVVSDVAAESPELFGGWTDEDWDELYSQFGVGGALREEGVRLTAARINHDRETLYRLRVVLQTHLADVASGMVETLYRLVSVGSPTEGGERGAADAVPAGPGESPGG